MNVIHCEVRWSTTDQATFDIDNERPVDDLVKMILLHAETQLPDSDSNGHPIHYVLYKIDGEQRTKILGRRSLLAAGIVDGDQLYLTAPNDLWWTKETTRSQDQHLGSEPQVNEPSPVGQAAPASQPFPVIQHVCRLQLIDGKVIDVLENVIVLNRSYLLKNLPTAIVIREQLKILFGFDSRLSRVSRWPHCEIIRQGHQWLLRVLQPTYIDGHMYEGKVTIPLSRSTTLILGRDGWLVEIQLT